MCLLGEWLEADAQTLQVTKPFHCPKKPTEERRISGEAAGCSPTFSTRERQIQAHSFTTTYVEPAGFNEMCSHCTL